MFEEGKMYEKIQAENERIRDLTRLAKERKEFNLMLRQKTRLRLKTPHAERTNHLADCDQLLMKTARYVHVDPNAYLDPIIFTGGQICDCFSLVKTDQSYV